MLVMDISFGAVHDLFVQIFAEIRKVRPLATQ